MKAEAVIFDMDGVIFDSERCCLEIWKELGKRYGYSDMGDTFYKCIGTTVPVTKSILHDRYGESFDADKYMEESSQLFHRRYDDGRLPLKPYAEDILKFLSESGFKVGLASSTKEATVRMQLKNAGLIRYFDTITCGDMLKKSKPEPDIYLMACEKTGVTPQNAIAIEDSYNGIRSAAAANMYPVMVPDMVAADDEMKRLSYKIFNNLKEVMEWIKALNLRNCE